MLRSCSLTAVVLAVSFVNLGCSSLLSDRFASSSAKSRAPKNWSIGVLRGAKLTELKEIVECPNPRFRVGDIPTPQSDFVADPFLVRNGSLWYLFFEMYNRERDKGEIGVAVSNDLCNWHYKGVALRESFHLSYPQVFKAGGAFFMVPESRQAKEIRLYQAQDFPLKWKLKKIIKQGEYSDPTLAFYDRRWWVFANIAPYGLAILSASRLDGDFVFHKSSPFYLGDSSRARPAGRILTIDGKLHRFVQDNRSGYGKSVRLTKVTKLNLHEFEEEILKPDPFLSGSGSGWNGFGMHHVSAEQLSDGSWVAVVDGNSGR